MIQCSVFSEAVWSQSSLSHKCVARLLLRIRGVAKRNQSFRENDQCVLPWRYALEIPQLHKRCVNCKEVIRFHISLQPSFLILTLKNQMLRIVNSTACTEDKLVTSKLILSFYSSQKYYLTSLIYWHQFIQAKQNAWIKSGRDRLFKITLQLHISNQVSSYKALQ